MQLRLNQLATQCDNGLPPFVLIFGDEPQQTIQALDTVREHALKAGFAERQSLTADADFDWPVKIGIGCEALAFCKSSF